MDEETGASDRPVEDMSYTEASAELDAIVAFFEGREVDVDQLVGRLVRATAIIEELDARLRRTRMQVEQLVPRLTAVLEDAAGGQDEPVEAAGGDEEPVEASGGGDEPVEASGGGDADRVPGLF
jgi:exonuclease VII small subunit